MREMGCLWTEDASEENEGRDEASMMRRERDELKEKKRVDRS
jgi:hypothetical protein